MPDGDRRRPALPSGMTPRLLCKEAAAAYCSIDPGTFETYIRPHVAPIEIGSRRVWDRRALDHWLDLKSGLVAQLRPIEDWLQGLGDGEGEGAAAAVDGEGARRQ